MCAPLRWVEAWRYITRRRRGLLNCSDEVVHNQLTPGCSGVDIESSQAAALIAGASIARHQSMRACCAFSSCTSYVLHVCGWLRPLVVGALTHIGPQACALDRCFSGFASLVVYYCVHEFLQTERCACCQYVHLASEQRNYFDCRYSSSLGGPSCCS